MLSKRLLLTIFFALSPFLLLGLLAYEKIETIPPGFKMPEPLPLKQSVAAVKAGHGLKVELIAAEPMVMDPISLDWGPDGKLWVVEMADYPLGIDEKGTPGGRVRYLEDSDGDGTYDKSTLFLKGLHFPTTVKAWKKGVLVVAAPEVFYAEDTDGDGVGDKKEVLFKGFKPGNQQHTVNTLKWGLDNWLHLANGDSGGKVTSVKSGDSVELGSFDLRVRPESGELQLETGRTQNGRTRDNWGNWYGCNNSFPLFQFVLPDPWLRRNPHITYPSAKHQVPEEPRAPRIYPAGESAYRFNVPSAANHITSACGLNIHRDPRLGAEFENNAFVCEPVHNLVHREVFSPATGPARQSHRAEEEPESEFLTSTDVWFRPTSARTGPDGAIWITDMHRYVIEHPEWIPHVWQEVLDLRAGADRGRIYRIVSEQVGRAAAPDLTSKSTAELAELLNSSNGWMRDTAHQMLLWKQDKDALDSLENILETGESPLGRLHSLCVLDGLSLLTTEHVSKGLSDRHPGVRRHAVRLSESFAGDHPGLLGKIIPLVSDKDPDVRFQLALTLGEWPGKKAGQALARLALDTSDDPFFAAASMSSLPPHLETVSGEMKKASPEQAFPLLSYVLSTALASKNQEAVNDLLSIGDKDDTSTRFTVYADFLSAIDRRKIKLEAYREQASSGLRNTLDVASGLTKLARELVADDGGDLSKRVAAVALLGRIPADRSSDNAILSSLLNPQSPSDLQIAAARRLGESRQIDTLLAAWSNSTPALRSSIVNICLSNSNDTRKLLDAIEEKKIAASSIAAAGRDRLMRYPNSAIRSRSAKLFEDATNSNRKAVVEKLASSLKLKGDPARGRELFSTACSVCHQLEGIGRHIGPDLTALSDKSSGAMLIAILDPNRAVEDKFLLYNISLVNGESLAGMIVEESGGGITLQILDGSRRSLLRSEIKSLESLNLSAMPEGLEAALDEQKLADIIAYVQKAGKQE